MLVTTRDIGEIMDGGQGGDGEAGMATSDWCVGRYLFSATRTLTDPRALFTPISATCCLSPQAFQRHSTLNVASPAKSSGRP